jgi:hypothetical protein
METGKQYNSEYREEKCNRVRERVVGGGDAAVPDGLGVAAVVVTVWSDCVLRW